MSHDWDPHFASVGDRVAPDWDAAVNYIDGLAVEQLAELLDATDVSAEINRASEEQLPAARELLRSDLAAFRQAVENGHPRVVRFWTRNIFIYVVDDRGPSDLWDSMPRLSLERGHRRGWIRRHPIGDARPGRMVIDC